MGKEEGTNEKKGGMVERNCIRKRKQLKIKEARKKTNQNDIHDEIKRRLNSGNACSYSVQYLLSSRLISKNLKIKIYKTVILAVVLYGCETWSLTLREEHRLRVFEYRRCVDLKGMKVERGENYIMLNFTACILHRLLLG
jgi:hypothetical protein